MKFKVGDRVVYSKYNDDYGGEKGYLRIGMIGTIDKIDEETGVLPYHVHWDNPKLSLSDSLEEFEIELLSKLHKAMK